MCVLHTFTTYHAQKGSHCLAISCVPATSMEPAAQRTDIAPPRPPTVGSAIEPMCATAAACDHRRRAQQRVGCAPPLHALEHSLPPSTMLSMMHEATTRPTVGSRVARVTRVSRVRRCAHAARTRHARGRARPTPAVGAYFSSSTRKPSSRPTSAFRPRAVFFVVFFWAPPASRRIHTDLRAN